MTYVPVSSTIEPCRLSQPSFVYAAGGVQKICKKCKRYHCTDGYLACNLRLSRVLHLRISYEALSKTIPTAHREPPRLTLDEYFQMRSEDLNSISSLPAAVYPNIIADKALSLNQYKTIVSDILHIWKCLEPGQIAVLRSLTNSYHFFHLSSEDVLALVQKLDQLYGGLEKADRGLVERILGNVYPTPTVAHLELLDMLHPVVMYHLEKHPLPPKKASVLYCPSQLIRRSGFYIRSLLIADKRDKVLEVFQVLMEKQFVQPIPELSASQEFGVIVLLTLTKAWFHWDWGET